MQPGFADPAVKTVFDTYPMFPRAGLLALRVLILETATDLPKTGGLQETLRWGQSAYLAQNRVGSTLRLGSPKNGGFALYAHCQTSIIRLFRDEFAGDFRFDSHQAVLFRDPDGIKPHKPVSLIRHALTYHLR